MFPVASFAFVGGMITGSFVGVDRTPRPARALDRRAPVGMRLLRRPDRRLRQHPDPLLALSARPLPQLRREHPKRYPAIELALGAAFAATAVVFFGEPAELALGLVFVSLLAAVTLTDLERRVIRTRSCWPAPWSGSAIVVATDP